MVHSQYPPEPGRRPLLPLVRQIDCAPLAVTKPHVPEVMTLSEAESLIHFHTDLLGRVDSQFRKVVAALLDRIREFRRPCAASPEQEMVMTSLQAEARTAQMELQNKCVRCYGGGLRGGMAADLRAGGWYGAWSRTLLRGPRVTDQMKWS